jgi:two-component system, OmpR family, response regulator MprA
MCMACSRQPRILVADDDPIIRRTIELILRQRGYVVSTAENGAEALDRITGETPDVLILDLLMPVLNGWEVMERLRVLGLDIPVVIASSVEPAIATVEAPGGTAYLTKPFRPDDLLNAVNQATASAASHQRRGASAA